MSGMLSVEEGAFVLDRERGEDDEDDFALVLEMAAGVTAELVYVSAIDKTVAEANPQYPADDPVATIVSTSWLDAYIGPWRSVMEHRPEELVEFLRRYAATWNIPLDEGSSDYPASRLEPVSRGIVLATFDTEE